MTEYIAETSAVDDETFQNPSESMLFEMVEGVEDNILTKKYTCNNCKIIYYKRSQIISHLKRSCCERKNHIVTDKVVPVIKKLPGLSKHKQTYFQYEPYQCEFCSKSFPNKTKLTQHTRTHSAKKAFCCEICRKVFSNSYSLKSHGKTHSGEKPYTCDVCRKSFAHSHILTNHKRTHSGEKPFKCEFCQKCFATSGTLVAHRRTHTGEQPYKCNICQKTFSLSSSLSSHKRTHTGDRPHKCNFCPKAFAKSGDLERHKRIHTGVKPFHCDVCDKSFTQSSGLIIHKRIHTGERPFACDSCERSFTNSASLIAHKRTHTGEIPHMPLHVLNAQQVSNSQNTLPRNECSELPAMSTTGLWDTGVPTPSVGDLSYNWSNWFQGEADPSSDKNATEPPVYNDRENMDGASLINEVNETPLKTGTPIKRPEGRWLDCDVCHKTFPYASRHKLIEHQRTHTREKPFKCVQCDKSFSLSSTLIVHKRMHTGERPFKCDLCPKAFAQKSKLNIHKRIHTGVKPFRCDWCHKTFAHSSNLADHKRTHTDEKPYECDVCHKLFTLANSLRKHKALHTGHKPYVCDVCRKAFAKKASLDRHKGTHDGVPQWTKPFAHAAKAKPTTDRGDENDKPFKCHVCARSFATANVMTRHAAKHSERTNEWRCEVCHKSFTGPSVLARHGRIHTGERPFQCDYCPKAFAYSSILVTHRRTHTGEKPYRCDVCPKAYTQSSSLIVHKRTHWDRPQPHDDGRACTERGPRAQPDERRPPMPTDQYSVLQPNVAADDYADDDNHWSIGWYAAEPDNNSVMSSSVVVANDQQPQPSDTPAVEAYPLPLRDQGLHLQQQHHHHHHHHHVPGQPLQQQGLTVVDVISSTVVPPQRFKCAKCKDTFDESSALLKHIRQTHRPKAQKRITEPAAAATFGAAKRAKKKRGERQRLECDICQRPFHDSYKLRVHRRTHTREKPYGCDVCDKRFIDSCNLKEHQKVHTGEKLFECDICQKTFLQLGTLTTHRRTHTGEKPYSCDVCRMPFALLSSMKTHKRRAHTGEKPHKCDYCPKAFVKRNDMVRHRRTHTGERPFVCDMCHQTFTQSYVLVLHKRNHHSADNRAFAAAGKYCTTGGRPPTVAAAKRIGACAAPKAKPYGCDVCPKSFASQSTLNTHRRTHTGEKPFRCDVCHKSFTQSSGLIAHKAAHHPAAAAEESLGQHDDVMSQQQYVGTTNVYAVSSHRIPHQYTAGDGPSCEYDVCQSSIFGRPPTTNSVHYCNQPATISHDRNMYYA